MGKHTFDDFLSDAGADVNIIPVMNVDAAGSDLKDSELPATLPILPMRNAILFPNTVIPVTIGRPKSIQLINDVFHTTKILGAATQMDAKIEDPTPDDMNHDDLLRNYRLRAINELLTTTSLSNQCIATFFGYPKLHAFNRFLTDQTGLTANEIREGKSPDTKVKRLPWWKL